MSNTKTQRVETEAEQDDVLTLDQSLYCYYTTNHELRILRLLERLKRLRGELDLVDAMLQDLYLQTKKSTR